MLARRRAAFAEMRRRNNVQDAARTPSERLADAEYLLRIALAAEARSGVSRSDEPAELWRRIREKQK